MKIPYIINIQKYAIHDGNGIRTTVFFKGCPLTCQWCHNPESQFFYPEVMYHEEKCTKCGLCIEKCEQKAISQSLQEENFTTDRVKCNLCGTCEEYCISGARKITGKQYTIKELCKEIKKDRVFYENSNGGVTLSGGEVLAQDIDYIESLMKLLYQQGYSINVDTCGFAPYENFQRVLPYTDTFLYDLKIIDRKKHIAFTRCDNERILDNIKRLSLDGANINVRIPLIEGVNADADSIFEIIGFLKENVHTVQVNVLPYHEIGKGKYMQLQREYLAKKYSTPDEHKCQEIVEWFQKSGFHNVRIGG